VQTNHHTNDKLKTNRIDTIITSDDDDLRQSREARRAESALALGDEDGLV
jgi:hypothetical protein